MFKSILVPIDLADTDLAKPAIATAATLSQTWSGTVRLLNVLPMTPVMLAEYVPADFDAQQRQTSEEALAIVARESGIEAVAHLQRGAAGRHLSRDPRGSRRHQGRSDRDDLAPAGDADLFPRLQCRPCRALRQMLGAGGAALSMRRGGRCSMKNWWRKWSYEIPLAFGDALWDVLVVQFAAFLDRLTLRKVIEFVAIAMLAMAFAQTLPIDLAILFAGDTLMYLEFLIAHPARRGRELYLREIAAPRGAAGAAWRCMRQRGGRHSLGIRLTRLRERRIRRIGRPDRARPPAERRRRAGMLAAGLPGDGVIIAAFTPATPR